MTDEPKKVRCFACNGRGVDEGGETCMVCGGEGSVDDESSDDPYQEVWQTSTEAPSHGKQ